MPAFRVTVPMGLYDAMVAETSPSFADSYLFGASLVNNVLAPRTVTAWEKLRDNWGAQVVLKAQNIALKKPEPFGAPGGSQMRDEAEPSGEEFLKSVRLRRA